MRIAHSLSLTMLCIALAGCANEPTVQSDYDHSVNFTRYQTYNFAQPSDGRYLTLQQKYLQDAISMQMAQRGYHLSNKPDLLVYTHTQLDDGLIYGISPAFVGWGGAWQWQTYDSMPESWTENSLVIDVVDPQKKQQVWQGIISQYSPGYNQAISHSSVNSAVASVFKAWPSGGLSG